MKKVKCVLIDPPSLEVNISDEDGLKETKERLACSPPIGLAHIAAVLREDDVEVKIIDAKSLNMSHKETCDAVLVEAPGVVGITVFTSQLRSALITAREIKENLPGVKIAVGGPHVHAQYEELIKEKKVIDICVRLEGEITMAEVVHAIADGSDFGDIPGIPFRAGDKVIVNPDRPFIENLNALPFPARDLLPNHVYRGAIGHGERSLFTLISASRGCPFSCDFCSVPRFWRCSRRRSVDDVIAEMREVYSKFGIEYMRFTDEVFVLNTKWVNEFCQRMIDSDLNENIVWSCDARVDLVDEAILQKMSQAGCKVIFYGIEFGNQNILDDCGKGIKIEQIYKAIDLSKKVGISPTGNFMLGYPTETKETIEDTIKLALSLDLETCSFSIVTPFPGCKLHNYCRDQGLLKTDDWEQFNYFHPAESVIRLPNIHDDELIELYRRIRYEYYFRHMKEELAEELSRV